MVDLVLFVDRRRKVNSDVAVGGAVPAQNGDVLWGITHIATLLDLILQFLDDLDYYLSDLVFILLHLLHRKQLFKCYRLALTAGRLLAYAVTANF